LKTQSIVLSKVCENNKAYRMCRGMLECWCECPAIARVTCHSQRAHKKTEEKRKNIVTRWRPATAWRLENNRHSAAGTSLFPRRPLSRVRVELNRSTRVGCVYFKTFNALL